MAVEHRSAEFTDRRFEFLVDAVEEYAIFMLDRDGRVASWNTGAQRIKGYEADEITGQHFSRFYPQDDIVRGKPEFGLGQAVANGHHREEGWRIRKDGTRFWAHVVITAVRDHQGRLTGFVKVTRDETARRLSESAGRQATEEALRAIAAKDQFLSRMSHELRTPLNAILGFGQLLEFEALTPVQHDSVARIVEAGSHLLELVNEVLDISQVSSGSMLLSPTNVQVSAAVHEATSMLRPLAGHRNVGLITSSISEGLGVHADPRRLQQVLVNLLANAVKYNRDGGNVHIGAEMIDPRTVRISVRDEGFGIADADLGSLFLPFERLTAQSASVEGSGLGLALSKHLTEAMNGSVGVTSAVGVGSTFWIDLPAEAWAADIGQRAAEHPRSWGLSTAARTVLYVEDNPSNVRLFERVVANRPSASLTVAVTGHEALQRVAEERPDVIFLDLHLPDMSGEAVLEHLRADPATAHIPVVVLSADATAERTDRMLDLGAVAYVTKPFDIQHVLRIIDDPGLSDGASRHADSGSRGVEPRRPAQDDTAPEQADVTGVAEVAHGLNNVLGVILNFVTLLTRSATDGRTIADLGEVRAAAEQAVQLVRTLPRPR